MINRRTSTRPFRSKTVNDRFQAAGLQVHGTVIDSAEQPAAPYASSRDSRAAQRLVTLLAVNAQPTSAGQAP